VASLKDLMAFKYYC